MQNKAAPPTKKDRGVRYWVGGILTLGVIVAPAQWISSSCHNVGGLNSGVVCSHWGGGLDMLVRAGVIAAVWVVVWIVGN